MRKIHRILFFALLVLSLLAGLLEPHHADGHWWTPIPAFFSLFGFAGSLLILAVAKALGKLLLHRKETYYHVD